MPPDVKILSNSWDVIDALISPPPPRCRFFISNTSPNPQHHSTPPRIHYDHSHPNDGRKQRPNSISPPSHIADRLLANLLVDLRLDPPVLLRSDVLPHLPVRWIPT